MRRKYKRSLYDRLDGLDCHFGGEDAESLREYIVDVCQELEEQYDRAEIAEAQIKRLQERLADKSMEVERLLNERAVEAAMR